MPFRDILPLLLFVAAATFSPGGATTLATASGANYGYRRSLPLIGGIATGLASMAALAALGLAALLLAAPTLQLGMKAAGSAYLIWLAWQTAQRGPPHATATAAPVGFLAGLWMLWHNPKAWAMTAGAAASFATLVPGPERLSMLLGAVFGTSAIVSLSLWCIAGLVLARLLRSDTQWRVLNIVLGVGLAASVVPVWL